MLAVIGALAALHQRQRTGLGQRVQTSLLDGVLAHLIMTLVKVVDESNSAPASSAAPTLAIYRCSDDRYLQLHLGARGALDRLFPATGLSREDFIGPQTGRHFAGDPEGAVRFGIALSEVFRSAPRDLWVERLVEADIPVAPCLEPGAALDHPQTRELEMVTELSDPFLGSLQCVAPPIRFSETPVDRPIAARQLGSTPNPEAALRHSGWPTTDELAEALAEDAEEGESVAPASAPAADLDGPPLAGLRVVDFGMFAAGPYAARLLAELGADVIKVEPPSGDTMRPNAHPFSGLHLGKRGLALDLKHSRAPEVLGPLLDRTDVVLHNFRPGVDARLGLDYERLSARNRGLIYFHSSGYGARGPMADLPGFDQIYQALCGFSVAQGGEGQPPEQVAGAPLDCLNALLTTAGVLMALYHRDAAGVGQHAECAQLGAGLFAGSEVYRTTDGLSSAGRLDGRRRSLGPGYRIEQTSDGWIFVCCTTAEERDALADFLAAPKGHSWLEKSSRWWTEQLGALLIQAFSLPETFDTGLLESALLTESSRVFRVRDPALGEMLQAGRFVQFSRAKLSVPSGGPALGQHSRKILCETGFSREEISEYLDCGVVVQAPEESLP